MKLILIGIAIILALGIAALTLMIILSGDSGFLH